MARKPEPIGGTSGGYRGRLFAIPALILTLFALIMVTGDTDRQVREFTEGCVARWADYERKVVTVDHGSATTHTCMVKVNGKWTPEANVKVTP